MDAATFATTCSFGDTVDVSYYTPPLGRLPMVGDAHSDPEVRVLQDERNVMAGSYSITIPEGDGITTVEAEWRLVADDDPGVG